MLATLEKHLFVLGHGEGDPGAKGVNKWERDYLEDLAKEMRSLIKQFNLENNIFILADRNTYKRNEFATNTAYFKQFKTVTDLHLNAFNGQASGAEILYAQGLKPDETDVRFFTFLKDIIGWRRWIESDYYQQTRNAKIYKIPSFRLVEYAFCDNTRDISIYVKEIKTLAKKSIEAVLGYELKEPTVEVVKSNVLYRVQTGAFTVEQNAKELEKKLNSLGYATYLIYERDKKLYKVQVGAYAVKDNAIKISKELSTKGFEVYIISTGDTDSVYIPTEHRYTDLEMAYRVIAGHYGIGQERVINLRQRGYDPAVVQTLVNDILMKNQPVKMKEFLKLHSNVTAWRVYPVGVSRIPQNAVGILNPRLFGGLEYEILEKRENGNVAIIQTKDFGKVQIWIGPDVKSIRSLIWK